MLWLGDRGKAFSYDALHKSLSMRANRAGVIGFYPHRLGHTAAHRWLAAGGSEIGLMAIAGLDSTGHVASRLAANGRVDPRCLVSDRGRLAAKKGTIVLPDFVDAADDAAGDDL